MHTRRETLGTRLALSTYYNLASQPFFNVMYMYAHAHTEACAHTEKYGWLAKLVAQHTLVSSAISPCNVTTTMG